MSWPQFQKITILKCCLLLFCATTTNRFSIRLWCAMKSELYTTSGDNQLSGWTKRLQGISQSQTCTHVRVHTHIHTHTQVTATVWWSAAGLIWLTTAFWIPLKPLHTRSMLSKSRDELKTAIPAIRTAQQKGPNSFPQQRLTARHTTSASKVEWIRLQSFAIIICHNDLTSCQLTTTSLSKSTTFCRENASTTSRMQKCFPRVCCILKHGFLSYRNKPISHWKKLCWL